jgi:hypothetical protein
MKTTFETVSTPPLHQSVYEVLRCETSYSAWRSGKKLPETLQSWRGTEIHHIAAKYAEHCASKGVAADWEYFDTLTTGVGEEAGTILEKMRDSYLIDYKHLFSTELKLSLDEDLSPIGCNDFDLLLTGEGYLDPRTPAAHRGTLDVLYLYEDNSALVEDYKSHFQAFDPETYQSMLYPFLVMKYFPAVRRVTFRLRFVRFENLAREIVWTREDIPRMERKIRQARGLQQAVELKILNNQPLRAFAHPGCHYCPLSANLTDCPISEFNPQVNRSIESRANFDHWWKLLATDNRKVLRDYVQTTGRAITMIDGTGQQWEYDAHESAKKVYPLDRTLIRILDDHTEATGEPWEEMKLTVSSTSLTPKLKAKKRTNLRDTIEASHLEMKAGVKYGFAKVLSDGSKEVDEDTRDYEEDGF